ncbi:hypothetical protein T12_4619 [Trichinella patagoniensis]|uniref:Uncharacterized protein n=1 Tax=Trichinella patagoniensis TaxID=990121 RepID=A0A0V0V093_9BILA|nr:hypothetical protein T12_4619 [Trichinella patagoniensis]
MSTDVKCSFRSLYCVQRDVKPEATSFPFHEAVNVFSACKLAL